MLDKGGLIGHVVYVWEGQVKQSLTTFFCDLLGLLFCLFSSCLNPLRLRVNCVNLALQFVNLLVFDFERDPVAMNILFLFRHRILNHFYLLLSVVPFHLSVVCAFLGQKCHIFGIFVISLQLVLLLLQRTDLLLKLNRLLLLLFLYFFDFFHYGHNLAHLTRI